MAVAEVFRALGDPLRLEMVQRLSNGVPCTISVVSNELGISRQGARKHLQVLADAGIIVLEPRGRDVLVQLDCERLDQAKAFITEIERHWDRRLAALKQFVEDGSMG